MSFWRVVRALALVAAAVALLTADAAADGRGGHHGGAGRPGHGPVYVPTYGYGWGFYGPWWPGYGFYSAGFWPYGWASPYPYAVAADGEASVRVQVTPPEAEVFVDGYSAGTVDHYDGLFERLGVAPGEHTIELYLQGYRSARQDLHVEPGGSYKIRYQMEPLAPGEPAPTRPVPPEPLPTPETGASRGVAAPPPTGVATAPAGFGILLLHTQPEDVDVFVDGGRWTASHGTLTLHLPPGRHHLELRRDGYLPFTTDVDIAPGEESPLNVMLPRAEGGEL